MQYFDVVEGNDFLKKYINAHVSLRCSRSLFLYLFNVTHVCFKLLFILLHTFIYACFYVYRKILEGVLCVCCRCVRLKLFSVNIARAISEQREKKNNNSLTHIFTRAPHTTKWTHNAFQDACSFIYILGCI